MTQAARAGTCPSTSAGYKVSGSRSNCIWHLLGTPTTLQLVIMRERKSFAKRKTNWKKCLASWKDLDQCTYNSSPSNQQFLKDSGKTRTLWSILRSRIHRGTQGALGAAWAHGLRAAQQTPLQRLSWRELNLGSLCSASKPGAALPLRKTVLCKCIILIFALMGWRECYSWLH